MSTKRKISVSSIIWAVFLVLAASVLYMISRHNYLLFHSFTEGFSIVIAASIFVIAWNTRELTEDNFLLFIGVAYLFVAFIDLLHTLAYSGMGIFPGYGTNLPTQLWISARYLESISLLLAVFLIDHKLRIHLVFSGFIAVIGFLLAAIFHWSIFPLAYVEGVGLTTFKIASEFVITLILLITIILLWRKRAGLDRDVIRWMIWSLTLTICSELAFTLYADPYGFFNGLGHFLKVASFYMLYKALIETGLQKPLDSLFRSISRKEAALRKSEQQLSLIYDSVGNVLFYLVVEPDNCFRFLSINQVFLDATGLTEDQVVGKRIEEVIPEPSFGMVKDNYKKAVEERRIVRWEETSRYPTGVKVGEVSIAPIFDDNGICTHMVGSVFDITERKKLESQLMHAQKMESLGVLAGGIAHDFNNLLMGIMGNVGLAQMKLPAESSVHDELKRVETAADRASELTNQMLAYSGKGRFVVKAIDLSSVVGEMSDLLKASIPKNVFLELDLGVNIPSIESDPTQIRQVVMNLITNAADAFKGASGTVTIATGSILCDPDHLSGFFLGENLNGGKFVTLEVSDTGSGMERETEEKIFDPFFTTKEGGRGLGLSAAIGIIRGHEGAIKVESEPGEGTKFTVLFPASEKPVEDKVEERGSLGSFSGEGTVLVVDDEETVREIATSMLEKFGFDVLVASDGEEALKLFDENADNIKLILMDLTMPKMGGMEALRNIKQVRADVKVILSSGYTEEDAMSAFNGGELADFIQKPYKPEELIEKVRKVLDTGS